MFGLITMVLVFMFATLVIMVVAGAVSVLPVIVEGLITFFCIKWLLDKLRH